MSIRENNILRQDWITQLSLEPSCDVVCTRGEEVEKRCGEDGYKMTQGIIFCKYHYGIFVGEDNEG